MELLDLKGLSSCPTFSATSDKTREKRTRPFSHKRLLLQRSYGPERRPTTYPKVEEEEADEEEEEEEEGEGDWFICSCYLLFVPGLKDEDALPPLAEP